MNTHETARYVTTSRIAELQTQLSARDLAILRTLASLDAATAAQLGRLHFTGPEGTSARQRQRTLRRLHTLGVLSRLDRRVGGTHGGSIGYVYALDIAGQRLTARRDGRRPRRPHTPSPQLLDHTLAVAETYVQAVELTRTGPLELVCFHTEPDCWRAYLGAYGQPLTLKPDAYAALRAPRWEDRYFIEIDRATQSAAALHAKTDAYRRYWASGAEQADHGVFPLVLFLTPDQQRAALIQTVINRQPHELRRMYHTAPLHQAAQVFQTGAQP